MHQKRNPRRPAGTGSLTERSDRAGRRTWYAKFRSGDRQVKRRLGRVREPGSTLGMTRRQAEAELRKLIERESALPSGPERIDLETAAERYIHHVEHVRGRKATTVADYRANSRRHLVPFFRGRSLDAIDPQMVEAYLSAKLREGLSRKTIQNHLTLLHGIFSHAVRRGWSMRNPVAAADLPSQAGTDPDIRYLGVEELEALLRAVPDDTLGRLERVLYLCAAMTGLRQGELVALRWRDVDWGAGVIRVRRSYTRGEFGAPKSRRSVRAVPMADRIAAEMERHFGRSRHTGDEDLVFAHPDTGGPYDASRMRKRFGDAVRGAGLRHVRFHDLRHTFGTRMAAAGAPLRAIQEWMGHRDYKTTSIYADHAPDPSNGRRWAEAAFGESGMKAETPDFPANPVGRFGRVQWTPNSGG